MTFWGQIWGSRDESSPYAVYAKRCSMGQRIFWGGNSPKATTGFEKSQKSSHFWNVWGPVAPKRCPLARKCPVQTFSVSARGIVWRWSGGQKSRNKIFFSKIFEILIFPHLGALAPTAPRSPPDLRPKGVRVWFKRLPKRFHRAGDMSICLLYTSPSPRDGLLSRMPSSA